MDLSGRTAFVTGSGRGIGRALSVRLATEGCDVVGCDLTAEGQSETGHEVEAAGRRYTALAADLSDADEAARVARAAIEAGPLDIVVNNAGVVTSGRYRASDFETWHKTVRIDLIAVMAITYEVLDHLRGRPRAHLINMSSVAGVAASAGQAAYNAAKFGVTGFTRSIGMECAGSKVSVTCVHPTMVRTRMIDGVTGSKNVPVIDVAEVADAVMGAVAAPHAQVFVPPRMRWVMDVFPRLMPNVAGRMALDDESAKSWLAAQKQLPDG